MHNQLWDVIYQYFAAQTKIYNKFESLDFDQQLALLTVTDDAQLPDPSIISLSILRDELCEILQQCKDSIALQLDETNTQFVISILAIVCDENVLTKHITNIQVTQDALEKYSRASAELKLSASWPKLQRQFSHCNNGGELFFNNLDIFLEQGSESQFLIELSYFYLSQGFRGKYISHHDIIKMYQDRCLTRLTERSHFSATSDRHTSKKQNNSETLLREQHAAST